MIRTRFAPSPTGALHIGGLRTALYAYALAKHNKGTFILRIEDTDKKREVPGSLEKIKELLKVFNLNWDEYYVQSERVKTGIYKKAAERLVAQGNAYEDGGAIRLKIPKDEKISFHDFVLDKDVSWNTNTLEDLVLLKSDGYPTYHLAVVVDDNDMKVSHVLRGHDWMPSTPIHLLVYKYLGYKLPEIGHLTDILDPEGGKLSKRKGSTSVEGMFKEGYLPEAILNFVSLLGWAPKDNREIFSLEDFVKAFDPKGFQRSNPVFDRKKLDWMNGEYIRKLTVDEFIEKLKPYSEGFSASLLKQITPLIKERIKKLSEFEGYAGFFVKVPKIKKSLLGKNSREHIKNVVEVLGGIKSWNKKSIDEVLMDVVKRNNFKTGDFFMDLRVGVTGSSFTPPINDSILILGKDETLKRLRKLI